MTVTLDLSVQASDPTTRRTLSNLSLAVAKSKRIVVVTGAGISCSSGIPDFRSSDGLYNLVKQRYPSVVLKGRDLFASSLFRDPTSTSVFYTFISQLKRSIDDARPSRTHTFIRTLDTKKRLLRSYTQNIDGLEERVGLLGTGSESARLAPKGKGKGRLSTKDVRNVQLHGDIHRVRCTFCAADFACSEAHMKMFDDGQAPDCPECTARSEARLARSARALKIGTLRPAIVLYDEPHPLGDDIGAIQSADLAKRPDMLIVMGTSLKVHGLKALVRDFAKAVHATASPATAAAGTKPVRGKAPSAADLKGKVVFVNRTPPPGEWASVFDYWIKGETDAWAERVEEDWRRLRPADWEVQQTLDGDLAALKVKKPNTIAAGKVKPKATRVPRVVEPLEESDDENVPPTSTQLSQASQSSQASHGGPPPSSPSVSSLSSPSPRSSPAGSVPSTPSKRRGGGSHYSRSSSSRSSGGADADSGSEASDRECSPSKKRMYALAHGAEAPAALLFGDKTNVRHVVLQDELFGSPMKAVEKTTPVSPLPTRVGPPRGRPRAALAKKKPMSKRGQPYGKPANAVDPAIRENVKVDLPVRRGARQRVLASKAMEGGQVRMEKYGSGAPL